MNSHLVRCHREYPVTTCENLKRFAAMVTGAYVIEKVANEGDEDSSLHFMDVALPDSGSSIFILVNDFLLYYTKQSALFKLSDNGTGVTNIRLHITDRWMVHTKDPMSQASLTKLTPADFGQEQVCGDNYFDEESREYVMEAPTCFKFPHSEDSIMVLSCTSFSISFSDIVETQTYKKIRSYSHLLPQKWQPHTDPCKHIGPLL